MKTGPRGSPGAVLEHPEPGPTGSNCGNEPPLHTQELREILQTKNPDFQARPGHSGISVFRRAGFRRKRLNSGARAPDSGAWLRIQAPRRLIQAPCAWIQAPPQIIQAPAFRFRRFRLNRAPDHYTGTLSGACFRPRPGFRRLRRRTGKRAETQTIQTQRLAASSSTRAGS